MHFHLSRCIIGSKTCSKVALRSIIYLLAFHNFVFKVYMIEFCQILTLAVTLIFFIYPVYSNKVVCGVVEVGFLRFMSLNRKKIYWNGKKQFSQYFLLQNSLNTVKHKHMQPHQLKSNDLNHANNVIFNYVIF